mgnify:CR=1 FL=1
MTALLILAIVCAVLLAPSLLILAARLLSESPKGVIDEVMALADVSLPDRLAAVTCLHEARRVERRTWLYDATAPLVTAVALLLTPRSANHLPRWARKWDNNVSLNGDGEVVLRDGQWVNLRDIGWMPQHGERVYTYDDPAYTGDAYYAKGHHPRSWWARWVWVGWRNRASQLSVDLGRDVAARPLCISGNPDIHRNGPYGHFLLKSGNCYHYKSINRWHGLALIRSYGYKLEIVRNSQDGTGLAAAVAIGRSLKRRKA